MNVSISDKSFYQSGEVPEAYRCQGCNAHGVKLWKHFQNYHRLSEVFCQKCVIKKSVVAVADMEPDGSFNDGCGMTQSIGMYDPAIPYPAYDSFRHSLSISKMLLESDVYEAQLWWESLPNEVPS